MPEIELPAYVLEIPSGHADLVLQKLRAQVPAVLAFIREDRVCFDVRTVGDAELEELGRLIKKVMA